jgi:hypothetical protein
VVRAHPTVPACSSSVGYVRVGLTTRNLYCVPDRIGRPKESKAAGTKMRVIGKRNQLLRIAVGDADTRRSNLWRITTYKSDVYVTDSSQTPTKFSFHKSGICRRAFTDKFGIPAGMQDRVMTKWKRAEIPARNTGKACSVLEIVFPTDFLSTNLGVPVKEVHWLQPAAAERSRCIEMFFSADAPDVAELLITQSQRTPIAAFPLDNGSWFYVTSHVIAFIGREMRIPAVGNRTRDIIIARGDALERSARVVVMSIPSDGDKMIAWEYGASQIEPTTDRRLDGVLSPDQVHYSTWR